MKLRTKFLTDLMTQLEKHLPAELSREFIAAYVQDTMDLSEAAILHAFRKARNGMLFFPKIAEIRLDAAEYEQANVRRIETRAVLERPEKPPGWQEDPEERQRFIDECKARSGILTQSIAEVAKSKQIPSLRESLNGLTAKRNGISHVPSDPAARKVWVHDQAIKMGWAPPEAREPGCEG